jgi:AraC family transcriptional regulator
MQPAIDPSPAGSGARVYAGALAGSGGREIEALQRGDDPGALAVVLYASPPYDVQVPALPVSRLSINLTAAGVSGALDGERGRSYLAPRHSLFLTPAGASAAWHKAVPSRHINIYFHPRAFDAAPLLNGTLPGGPALFDALAGELAGGEPFAAEAVDSLARLILVRLTRRRLGAQASPLSDGHLQRLREFVAARLDQRVLVADLAAVAGLSPNRFAQAFAARTGRSPHQYVLACRLERATQLLQQTRQPLADVAAGCGFASQQHMTQLMSRRLGITPARLRAERAA